MQTLAFALNQMYFHKSVILILSHDDNFTKGVILNRPTSIRLDGWPLLFGGELETGELFQSPTANENPPNVTCLHRLVKDSIRAMSTRVTEDVYSISFSDAKSLVALGEAQHEDFWVLAGYAGWASGQLLAEIERQSWYLAAEDAPSLLGELLPPAGDPLSLPRIDADTGQLMPGGDGLKMWNRLAGTVGLELDTDPEFAMQDEFFESDFADRALRQWVQVHLMNEQHRAANSRSPSDMRTSDETLSLQPGAILMSSKPFLFEKQYLHKAIIVVLQVTQDMLIAAVLNRPRMTFLSFELPGKGPDAGKKVKRRVSFGGEIRTSDVHSIAMHHKPELGGVELGKSGLFFADANFTGQANDLILLSGVLSAWAPPDKLQRQIEDGIFTVVPNGKALWGPVWELMDASALHSSSLEERIADLKATFDGPGEIQVVKEQAIRLAKRSIEVWELAASLSSVEIPKMRAWEDRLTDEVLFEWCKAFITGYRPPPR